MMEATTIVRIRQYAPDDFTDVARLLKEFHAEALADYGLNCEHREIADAIMDSYANTLVLEMDRKVVGLISGKVISYPLQKAKLFQEMIWYVSKDYRRYGLKLLKELEKRCKDRGINMIIMVALGNSMAERLHNYYERLGYRELETHYIRVLE
ncbi:MAG: GNAT family N-acetyltransferase, partial [Phycisphaerae bacterium]|nr:GNAT family N-acetyltransferase [Phycisphaerae bacterium]